MEGHDVISAIVTFPNFVLKVCQNPDRNVDGIILIIIKNILLNYFQKIILSEGGGDVMGYSQ